MPKAIFFAALFGFLGFATLHAQGQANRGTVSVDGLAALFVLADSNEVVESVVQSGRDSGLSDVQIATAFGLALETCLQEGPREHLPILMTGFEDFVVASGEPVGVISNAFEAGQELARSRAEAGRPMIDPEDTTAIPALRSSQAPLRSSPVGGGSSARGATGGGGGGVVSGGASPS